MKMTNENHIRIDGETLAAELGYDNLLEMRMELSRMSNMRPGELKPEDLTELTEIEVDGNADRGAAGAVAAPADKESLLLSV